MFHTHVDCRTSAWVPHLTSTPRQRTLHVCRRPCRLCNIYIYIILAAAAAAHMTGGAGAGIDYLFHLVVVSSLSLFSTHDMNSQDLQKNTQRVCRGEDRCFFFLPLRALLVSSCDLCEERLCSLQEEEIVGNPIISCVTAVLRSTEYSCYYII